MRIEREASLEEHLDPQAELTDSLERIGAQVIAGQKLDAAFIGSCTNSRISDLRIAANILRGRKVAVGVNAICVPGSMQVKAQAEAEGLDKVFVDAGFQWLFFGNKDPPPATLFVAAHGCSMV